MTSQATSSSEVAAALHDVLPDLTETYGRAAATTAAEWYEEIRDTAGVAGRFAAIPSEAGSAGADALAGWATSEATSEASLSELVEGGLQRRIANAARSTVAGSSVADPMARGWQRQGVGECHFCEMLISRGAVYSKATADFASHDHCECEAVPVWNGRPVPVKAYKPSNRNISDADRARVRKWIQESL